MLPATNKLDFNITKALTSEFEDSTLARALDDRRSSSQSTCNRCNHAAHDDIAGRTLAHCATTVHICYRAGYQGTTDNPSISISVASRMAASETFYGRALPTNLIDYRSSESKTRLCRSLREGNAVPYLSLSSCFNTQAEPAYCGLSTLAIILNSLRIDPQRIWKTIWRWYSEDLLNCCRTLDHVKQSGVTLEEFVCLAECNGTFASLVRPCDTQNDFEEFVQTLKRVCTGGREKGNLKEDANVGDFDEENPTEYMAVSFSRRALGQTGDGHFSPIAAFDSETNSVLVFDTARFKYPPYWVPVGMLFQAMLPLDKLTGKSRGYVILKAKYSYEDRKVCCIWRGLPHDETSKEGLPLPNLLKN